VSSDGDDGPPQALAGSVVAGGVGAMVTLSDMAAAVVDAAARVITAAGCDVTESVTLSDRDSGSNKTRVAARYSSTRAAQVRCIEFSG
jgi:hypothetical protein